MTIPGSLETKRREGAGSLPAVEEARKKIAGIKKLGDEDHHRILPEIILKFQS